MGGEKHTLPELAMQIGGAAVHSVGGGLALLRGRPGFASPAEVGMTLYQKYALPFEVTSAILLVAMVGAIVLTRTEKSGQERTVSPRPGGED